jgi:hypothetical protein
MLANLRTKPAALFIFPFLLFNIFIIIPKIIFPAWGGRVASYIKVDFELWGSREDFIKKGIYSSQTETVKELRENLGNVILGVGYVPKSDFNDFRSLDYSNAFIRRIALESFVSLCILLLFIGEIFRGNQKNRILIATYTLGAIFSASFTTFIVQEGFYIPHLIFPETAKYFHPLILQPDYDQYYSRSYTGMTFTIAFLALIATSNKTFIQRFAANYQR